MKTASKAEMNKAFGPATRFDVVGYNVHGQVAGQLGQPRAGGVRGDAEEVDAVVVCSMTKNAKSR